MIVEILEILVEQEREAWEHIRHVAPERQPQAKKRAELYTDLIRRIVENEISGSEQTDDS